MSTSPFSLSGDTYVLGDLTAIHEIGHSLGGQHVGESADDTDLYTLGEFSHGIDGIAEETIINGEGQPEIIEHPWQTIMGGYTSTRCRFESDPIPSPDSQPCERLRYFSDHESSPVTLSYETDTITIGTDVKIEDTAPGTFNNNAQFKADMQAWLEQTGMLTVSSYFEDANPPPSTPLLEVQSGYCYGLNDVSWNFTSTATSYQLFRSFSSSFTSPSVIYEGENTSFTANVTAGSTWYLRVKACNAGGCSAYSSQRSANYNSSCL